MACEQRSPHADIGVGESIPAHAPRLREGRRPESTPDPLAPLLNGRRGGRESVSGRPLARMESLRPETTRRPHSGMTLLELMLALSLSVVVMGVIAIVIDLHLRTLDTRRTEVEEAQLARAVLRQMA